VESKPQRSQSDNPEQRQANSEPQKSKLTKKSGSFAFSKDSKLQAPASKEAVQTKAKALQQPSKLQAPGKPLS